MTWTNPVSLGRSGLRVGRLGIASSYGAPTRAYEEAFERGCNYFTWGSFIKGRNSEMRTAIRNIIAGGKRDALALGLISYAHNATLMTWSLKRALRSLGTDRVDLLIIGYHNRRPSQRELDRALALREAGLVGAIALTSHNRSLFPQLASDPIWGAFHVRYNAAHRGAESEVFPLLGAENRPGLISFTATRWGKLLQASRMPAGEPPPSVVDCYRFVLSNPAVDVCMVGPRNLAQMREALTTLDRGPFCQEELARLRRIGDHVHG